MSHPADIIDYRFFLAPHAGAKVTFTISSPTQHFTFKIKCMETQGRPNTLLISVMNGPDNENNYSYIGIIKREARTPTIIQTRKSKVGLEAQSVRALLWVMRHIQEKKPLPSGYKAMHSGNCCRCGRKLTTPESITLGIGPTCAASGW